MGKNKTKNKKFKIETLEDKMKYEIAQELGLLDRVLANGWSALTAKETGRIGGIITKKKKEMQKQVEIESQNQNMSQI